MKQTRRMSIAETVVSTIVGFLITLLAQRFIFPAYGIHTSYAVDFQIVGWFTLLSIARGYVIRRFFNAEWWKDHLSAWRMRRAIAKRQREMETLDSWPPEHIGCGCHLDLANEGDH
jgi:hypothetical protein